jgi:uncharacterized protein YhdP
MTRYHITGSWQKPKIKRIAAESVEEEDEPLFFQ